MNGPHPIWLSIIKKPNKTSPLAKPARRKYKQLKFLLESLKEKHPDIYSGTSNTCLTREEADQFCNYLQTEAPGHIYKQRKNLFILGLERGEKQLGWNVYIPAPVTTSMREPARFTKESFQNMQKLRTIEVALLHSLRNPIPDNHGIILGYLTFTSIVYGGLLEKQWLISWLKLPMENLIYEDDLAWLDLYREIHSKQKGDDVRRLHKRWFIDPLTLLILSSKKDYIKLSHAKRTDPWTHLSSLMHHLNIPDNKDKRPENMREFITLAHTRLSIYVKEYLADYALGKIKSASLSPAVWARIRKGVPIPIESHSTTIDEEQNYRRRAFPKVLHNKKKMPSNMLNKLYSAIFPMPTRKKEAKYVSGQSKKNVEEYLSIYGDQISPVVSLIAQWCINQFTYKKGRRRGSMIASSTVHSYVTTIAKPLHLHVLYDDITNYSEVEFYELYKDVIESKGSENAKQTTAARLAEFHEFLAFYWAVPAVDLSEFHLGKYKAELAVDSNLICPPMYRKVLEVFGGLVDELQRNQIISLLIIVLGFKCGLRRAEVLTIACSDICGTYNPVLFLRHNPYAYKKSDNGVRKIPLRTFLSQKELAFLKLWVKQRNIEDGVREEHQWLKENQRRLLFCSPGQPTRPVDETTMFAAIHNALRQVTRDQNIHYHSLRHSFSTWFLYRLESGDKKAWRPEAFIALKDISMSARQCKVYRHKLRLDTSVNRKSLYELTLKCGHSSPEMPLRHYIHLLDLMLGCSIMQYEAQPILCFKSIMQLIKQKKARVYRIRQESDSDQWIPSLFIPAAMKELKQQLKDPLIKQKKDFDLTPVTINPSPINWKTVQRVLEDRGHSISDISRKYSIDSSLLEKWLCRVNELEKMRTRRTILYPEGKPRHNLDNKSQFFPTCPISRYDIEMVHRVVTKYQRAQDEKRRFIAEWVKYFIDHFATSSPDIRFSSRDDASAYTNFLMTIGLNYNEIRLIHYRPKGCDNSTANEQMEHWTKWLSVPIQQCTFAKGTYGKSNGYGTVGISVSAPTGCIKENGNEKTKFTMPYGFRYALYIIFIINES